MHTHSTRRTPNTLRAAGIAMLLAGALLTGAHQAQAQSHAVFTSSNAANANSILMFRRADNGALTPIGTYFTGGAGTGAGLGSQGAIALSSNGKWLFTVNAGSNDVSVFSVRSNDLKLITRVPSGGTNPISLTVYGNLLYVLNAGTPNNVTGFRVGSKGYLTPIPGSTQPLSGSSVGPAEVAFDPWGDLLVVTEKNTNLIDVFPVNPSSGAAGEPVTAPSVGVTPFGFAFDQLGRMFVSEADGGMPGATTVSSYYVSSHGVLPITASAADGQTAACWIAINKADSTVWAVNAHSNNISAYSIWPNGTLSLLGADDGVVATPGNVPTDVALDEQNKYFYALEAGVGAIAEYAVKRDGMLTLIGTTASFGGGFAGMAAW